MVLSDSERRTTISAPSGVWSKKPLPPPTPDTAENIARAVIFTAPKKDWRHLKRQQRLLGRVAHPFVYKSLSKTLRVSPREPRSGPPL